MATPPPAQGGDAYPETLTFVRSNGSVLQSTPENFKDAWKFALGARYRSSDAWMWRAGVAVDRSPVEDAFRTPKAWAVAGVKFGL